MEDVRTNFHKGSDFYIFGDIDETMPENIIAPLYREIIHQSKQLESTPIRVFITSNGGNLDYAFDIIALFEMAKTMEVEIVTIVLSCAASAASLIAVAGHTRVVSSRAYHLLHYARGWDFSHNPEMSERNQKNTKFLNNELVKIYEQNTKLVDVKKLLLADNFIVSGKDLIKHGLADKII